ncbi:MAG: hypothetical protein O3C28_08105 [Proteobacteria bacterium]|nr:hypothetical protein [Pseudomonadota bacterium]
MGDTDNLADLRRTLSDAAEISAAFVGTARDNVPPIESLVIAAENSMSDLAIWRNTIADVIDLVECNDVH